MFVACVDDAYFDEGSNAQKEYLHALSKRLPGVDMVVVKISSGTDMRPVTRSFGSDGVFDLSGELPLSTFMIQK